MFNLISALSEVFGEENVVVIESVDDLKPLMGEILAPIAPSKCVLCRQSVEHNMEQHNAIVGRL